jgi:LuxR family maltose regulon positive regulatory protein
MTPYNVNTNYSEQSIRYNSRMGNSGSAQPALRASKLFLPLSPSSQVTRPHLIQRLNDGLSSARPLTLISAPAGYGKSALAAEWVKQTKLPITWLALDMADDEPSRFFLYFISALQKINPSIGEGLAPVLRAGQLPPQETLLTELVNDLLTTKSAFICVLDDFQFIQDKFILDVLYGLLNHQLHLVIITREDPALPLARLRVRNQLTEIRANDLRFSGDEIQRFLLNVMRIRLSGKDISLLEERTEGWVAGLQLAGLSMQGRENPSAFVEALSGSHRHILSYLTEEVLNRQSAQIQNFLLQTSILSKLNGDLCNAVTGQADSAALLEQSFTSNLFLIPLDDEGHWYRYHHLFAELLLDQLRRASPEQITELHQRASQWYENHHMYSDAIEHALAAEDFSRVMDLLETHVWGLLNEGYARRVEAWMQSIPLEKRAQSPHISLGFAWMHMLRGRFGQVVPYLKQAESALENMPESKDTISMQAECFALQSNLMQAQGKIPESIEAAQRALQIIDPESFKVRGLAYLGLGAGYRQAVDFDKAVDALQQAIRVSHESGDLVTGTLATTHLVLMCLQHGRLRFAAEVGSKTIEWLEHSEAASPPIVGSVYGALGLVYYEWDQIEKAREYFQRGIHLGMSSGHNASVIYTMINLVRLLQSQGDLDSASKTLSDALELFQTGAPGWLRPGLIARQVNLYLAQNNITEAETVLRQSNVLIDDEVAHSTDEIHIAYLRLLLERGEDADLNQGVALAARIISLSESRQRDSASMQALTLGALLHTKLGDSKTSLVWLERALALAEPEGYLRLFVDEGLPLAALLYRLPNSAYAKKLLDFFPSPPQGTKTHRSNDELIEPLTERELEILRLFADGLKYAEIAEQLVVSVNTVRYHVKGIYGKLSVDKQSKAVERARALGLIQ